MLETIIGTILGMITGLLTLLYIINKLERRYWENEYYRDLDK